MNLIIAVDLSSKISGVSVFRDNKYIDSYLIKMKSLKDINWILYANTIRSKIVQIIRKHYVGGDDIDIVFEENKKHSSIVLALGIWVGVLSNIEDINIYTIHPTTWYKELKLGRWNDLSKDRKLNSLNYFNKNENKNETNDNISDSYCIGKWYMEKNKND